jgi:hypothetical protein
MQPPEQRASRDYKDNKRSDLLDATLALRGSRGGFFFFSRFFLIVLCVSRSRLTLRARLLAVFSLARLSAINGALLLFSVLYGSVTRGGHLLSSKVACGILPGFA